jgi:hypothetical protein
MRRVGKKLSSISGPLFMKEAGFAGWRQPAFDELRPAFCKRL